MQAPGAANVVDVGVGDHDGGYPQAVAPQDLLNLRNLVSGIDDNPLARSFVAEDRTVTLSGPTGRIS
jgi:hypothetical protein